MIYLTGHAKLGTNSVYKCIMTLYNMSVPWRHDHLASQMEGTDAAVIAVL